MTAACRQGDRCTLEEGSIQALLTAAVISVPAAAGTGVLAPEVLGVLFPRQSDEAAVCISALRFLMVGMICLCLSYPLFGMLQAVGKPSAPLWIMLAGTAAKAAGNLLLIPVMGVDGAALSTTLCYILMLALALRSYTAAAGVHIGAAPFLKVAYCGAMCGGTALLVRSATYRWGAARAVVLAVSAAAGGGVYMLLLRSVLGRRKSRSI
jgi:stage V sporulation protein B